MEREISRRDTAIWVGGAVLSAIKGPLAFKYFGENAGLVLSDSFGYYGVPDTYFEDDEFWQDVEQDFNRYHEDVLKKGEPNMMMDVRLSEGVEVSYDVYDDIEEAFSPEINALVLEHKEKFSRQKLDTSEDVVSQLIGSTRNLEEILGLQDIVYNDIDSRYRYAAIQVFMVPWEIKPGCCESSDSGAAGAAVYDRAVVRLLEDGFNRYSPRLRDVVLHEIGHILGEVHVDDENNLMYEEILFSKEQNFSDEQLERFAERLF